MKPLTFCFIFLLGAACAAADPPLPSTVLEVNAPVWTGRPPCDAICGLVRLPSGEIRHYDYGFDFDPNNHRPRNFLASSYIVSHDQGLTWETKAVKPGELGADMQSPVSGEYMRLHTMKDGVYVIKTKGGIEGEWTMHRVWDVAITAPELNLTRSLVFIRGGKRVLSPWSTMRRFPPDFRDAVGTIYSDDDGETWQHSNLIEPPAHVPNARDKSVRWQNGGYEPTVVELKDGRLWMIIRTSLDYHYQSFSSDGGATWSAPQPSPFYGTLTDPTIGRLKDGRLLFLWNNTLPLPEFEKPEAVAPFIPKGAFDGSGEDVFTNREALHGAISDDDGRTWRGFREVLLDSCRNDKNFGETGGLDRSVHQPQFVEVAGGRVVVSTGQHWLHRSMFVFNPDWLLETKRSSDFANGLDDWSVHGYFKGIRGHCSFNRYESSSLIPHPDDAKRKVLRINTTSRQDAIFPRGGATWNFPAGHAGFVEARVRLSSKFGGSRICLLDRWVNPVDPTVADLAMTALALSGDGKLNTSTPTTLKPKIWHALRLVWKSIASGSACDVILDGQSIGTVPLAHAANHGISYVHFQSTSVDPDEGLNVESVTAEVTP